jgi:hypothetical protein
MKITCQSKSSTWTKPPYSEDGCLKGLSPIRRPSQCRVSRSVYAHSVTFSQRRNRPTTHFSELIPCRYAAHELYVFRKVCCIRSRLWKGSSKVKQRRSKFSGALFPPSSRSSNPGRLQPTSCL